MVNIVYPSKHNAAPFSMESNLLRMFSLLFIEPETDEKFQSHFWLWLQQEGARIYCSLVNWRQLLKGGIRLNLYIIWSHDNVTSCNVITTTTLPRQTIWYFWSESGVHGYLQGIYWLFLDFLFHYFPNSHNVHEFRYLLLFW